MTIEKCLVVRAQVLAVGCECGLSCIISVLLETINDIPHPVVITADIGVGGVSVVVLARVVAGQPLLEIECASAWVGETDPIVTCHNCRATP